jgi:hypothetical protein
LRRSGRNRMQDPSLSHKRPLGLLFPRNFEPLTAPDALHAIGTDVPTGCIEQLSDPAIAIASILRSQSHDRLCQRIFIGSRNNGVTLRAPRLADEPAGLALRETILLPNPLDRLPAPFGAYKFPEAISFSTCFSRERSATSRFSRAFSFSRSFIRRA